MSKKETNIIDDPVDYARSVVGKDPMASFLGINVEEVKSGYARCSVTIKPEYMNAVERAHGSIIYALADQAFAVAANSTGVMALAVNFTITFLTAAVDGERIFAEALPVHIGKKTSVWSVQIRGSKERLVATGQGIAYHK